MTYAADTNTNQSYLIICLLMRLGWMDSQGCMPSSIKASCVLCIVVAFVWKILAVAAGGSKFCVCVPE